MLIQDENDSIKQTIWNISTDSIIEPYDLIYAEKKLVSDKFGIPRKKLNNTIAGCEIRLKGQIKKLRKQAKVIRMENTHYMME